MKREFSPRQGEYLAFIAQYRELVQASPSEGDIAHFFGVSGPSAHQMLVTLEARSLLVRVPGIRRSARLTVPRTALPTLGGPAYQGSDPLTAIGSFAVYVAERLTSGIYSPIAKYGALLRLAARLEEIQVEAGAPPALVRRSQRAVLRIARRLVRSRTRSHRVTPPPTQPVPTPPPSPPRKRKPPVPGQGTLF